MTFNTLLHLVFWFCITASAYIYVGYPTLIWFLARCRPRKCSKQENGQSVSVVIVVHNEARNMVRKLNSIFGSNGADRIGEVIIASDGSTDDTAGVLKSFNDPRVRLLHFDERRGKPAVLNEAIPACQNEIVVLTDARQELDPAAINELVANFSDESVGAVSGELVLRHSDDDSTAAHGIGVYWKYEKFIRRNEGRFRSVPGATGALYAIRKPLFRPIHPQTLLDDVVIPMQVVTQGFRCLFEPAAIAYDLPSQTARKETIRKRRTIAGTAQLLIHHPAWLLPWRNPIWLEFVSHKVSRLLSPLLLILLAASNIALASHPFYRVLLSVHGCFYLSALAGWWFQKSGQRSACFGAQFLFVTLNLTTVFALWDAMRGGFRATWQRT